jgi:hypothetical protein
MKYLILSAMAALMLASCKDKIQDKEDLPVDHNIPQDVVASGPECYLNVVGRDSMIFQMERKGDSVYGVFNWKPYEKDTKLTNFKGTLINGNGKALGQVSAEGMNTTEEFNFTVQDTTVTVKYAEMEQGSDGIWYYKAGTPVSEQVLSKVKCP